MGRERTREGQYLYLCAAGLIIVVLSGCAPIRTMLAEREGRAQMQRVQPLIRKGDFEGALRETRKVLVRSPKSPPADAALFSMGLILADHANPEKDYRKALGFFTQLVHDFPQSPFAEEGRVWAGILENEIVGQEGRSQMQRVEPLIRQGDFEGALRENQKVLALFPKSPPADGALFSMGLILADHANPKRDYKKARGFFAQVVKDFPQSPFAEEAGVLAGALENDVSAEWEGCLHLQRVWLLTRQGDFDGAQRENQKVLAVSPKSSPGDAALFSMGLILADHANPKRDYKKALNFFMRLKKEFPGSPFVEEAKIWIGVLETVEKALQIDIKIDEKTKELRK